MHVSFNPLFNISINNSNIAEPKKETRKQIILGLQEYIIVRKLNLISQITIFPQNLFI
jgi:hypothetical protein